MEVTWHREDGVAVLSLWQDQTCRSTFRLPVEDAPALITLLSSALGDAVVASRREERPDRVIADRQHGCLLASIRRVVRPARAEIVPLLPRRRRPGTPTS